MFKFFKETVEQVRGDMAEGERLFREGRLHAGKGRHAKAVEAFTKSIAAWDAAPAAFICRGASYQAQDRFQDAWNDYSRALEMETTDPSPTARDNIFMIKHNMAMIEEFIH